jgi:hypothetical protein
MTTTGHKWERMQAGPDVPPRTHKYPDRNPELTEIYDVEDGSTQLCLGAGTRAEPQV